MLENLIDGESEGLIPLGPTQLKTMMSELASSGFFVVNIASLPLINPSGANTALNP
jgi:hypothetical protein